jgi:predicted ABC-type exoprotein transport system permease subunit
LGVPRVVRENQQMINYYQLLSMFVVVLLHMTKHEQQQSNDDRDYLDTIIRKIDGNED